MTTKNETQEKSFTGELFKKIWKNPLGSPYRLYTWVYQAACF
jgi:hypothetical protein